MPTQTQNNPATALPVPDPESVTLSARFCAVVERFGGRVALTSRGRSWTYAQLGHAATNLAGRIHDAEGPAGDTPVGLLLDQGFDFLTGIYGTLATGRPFVPLDPSYPVERLAAMREDAGLSRVVCTAEHLDQARAIGFGTGEMVVLDRGATGANTRYQPGPATPRDPAYIMFTSGSTGRPKGVIQTHRNAVQNYTKHLLGFELKPTDRQSLVYPTSVYGGMRDILNATLTGATLCHYPLRELGYAGLGAWVRDERLSIYCSVASVFRRFARHVEETGQFPQVRLIKLGGESVHPEDLRQFQRLFSAECVLFSGLGSTETGMSCRHPIHANDQVDPTRVPLGRPVEATDVLLVDEQRNPVAEGAVGEIAVRSRYLTEGYLGRDDLNAQVFTRDADDPDLKTYYTGDLGQRGDDGLLYHRGRKDHQVKVRGNRVELTEVETRLQEHPAIHDAVALALPDESGDTRLEAFVVFESAEAEQPTATQLRDDMIEKLPRFAVPCVFRALDAFPLTPNGKIDRKQLPEVESRRLLASTHGNPPHGPTEETLADLFSKTLGENVNDAEASFFDLGGDSLKAVDLLLRIEATLGREVPLSGLLGAPSVRLLAGLLDEDDDADVTGHGVVALRCQGARPPLFVLSGRGGSVACYHALLSHLPDDVPVYGIELPGIAPGTEPIDRVEPLATWVLDAIRTIEPEGPHRLLGYSFGGLVVYEVARQLEALRQRPAWVGIIDKHTPGSRQPLSRPQRAAIRFKMLLKQSGPQRRQWFADKVKRMRGQRTDKPGLAPDGDAALLQRLNAVNAASIRAGDAYEPGEYGGIVDVFPCRLKHDYEMFFAHAPDCGWSSCTRVGKVRPIDSKHLEVFAPHCVGSLGKAVSEALRLLDAQSRNARAA